MVHPVGRPATWASMGKHRLLGPVVIAGEVDFLESFVDDEPGPIT